MTGPEQTRAQPGGCCCEHLRSLWLDVARWLPISMVRAAAVATAYLLICVLRAFKQQSQQN